MTHAAQSTPRDVSVMILAAGKGSRMHSALPKVLHTVAGRPLIDYAVRAALDAGFERVVVVVGHGREQVEAHLKVTFDHRVEAVVQPNPRGTGDAVRAALAAIPAHTGRWLVCNGDAPLLQADDLTRVVRRLDSAQAPMLAIATCVVPEPFGYGRILRNDVGAIVAIREETDLTCDEDRAITEINPGLYAASDAYLRRATASLSPANAQGEYYLTDIVAVASEGGVVGVDSSADVLAGVNDRDQLAAAERVLHDRIARRWRLAGVTVRDGARIDDGVTIGRDSTIETGVVLRGGTTIGERCVIDVGSVLSGVEVGDDVAVEPYSVIRRSSVGPRARIGPFSHLRPESVIGEGVHVGNFVETKKTRMARGAKANHLAYLGDGEIGEGANIGAGTIFCNYDGFNKHTTVIGPRAFIGSDSQLVAPVRIGEAAYVATGTTVTRDVPDGALAIGRTAQKNKEGYAELLRRKFRAVRKES